MKLLIRIALYISLLIYLAYCIILLTEGLEFEFYLMLFALFYLQVPAVIAILLLIFLKDEGVSYVRKELTLLGYSFAAFGVSLLFGILKLYLIGEL